MKYLKLYEKFRLILEKLDNQGKKLFLLCGPSATGKTYLADQIGIKHWTKSSDFKGDCLITTDNENGEMEKITQLLEAKGCPKLAEISKTFKDDLIFSIKAYYQDVYKKWESDASEEEKKILDPLWSVITEENMKCPNTGQTDPRVWKLASIAYLWGPGRIIFDDVRPTINKIYDGVKEYIIYTPITTYLSDNLVKRLVGEPDMNVKGKIEKFFEWYQLSETPDTSFPDNKKYTLEEVEASMKGLKQKKTEDVIDTYGTGSPIYQMRNTEFGDMRNTKYQLNIKIEDFVTISKITDKMKKDGFYFKKGGIQGDKDKSPVFNSRSDKKLSL
jgi:hypothetical protein